MVVAVAGQLRFGPSAFVWFLVALLRIGAAAEHAFYLIEYAAILVILLTLIFALFLFLALLVHFMTALKFFWAHNIVILKLPGPYSGSLL